MKRFEPVVIVAQSGNRYNVFANSDHTIRVTSREFNPKQSVVFNRVEYDLVADFTINQNPKSRWEQFYLYLARTESFAMDASVSATEKARKEVAEVARIYVEQHRAHLAEQVALGFEWDAVMAEQKATEHAAAVSKFRQETQEALTQAEQWRSLCT